MTTKTRISLPLPAVHGPVRFETLWAEQVGRARYRLLNSSFFLPLAVGDVVKTLRRRGRTVVTEFVRPGEMSLSFTVVDSTVSEAEQRAVTEAWRADGASWTEGAHGLLLTVWRPEVSADDVFALLVKDVRARQGWHAPAVYDPEDRQRIMRTELGSGPDTNIVSLAEHRVRRSSSPQAGVDRMVP